MKESRPHKFVSLSSKGIMFIIPFICGTVLFRLWPLIQVVVVSFLEGYSYLSNSFSSSGLHNYIALFNDASFINALLNTFIYSLVVIASVLVIAFPTAWCLLRTKRLTPLFQFFIFLPFVTSDVAVGITWRILFGTKGVVNLFVSLFRIGPLGWLTDAHFSLPTIILFGIWGNLPMSVLIIYCSMLNIPKNIMIAAKTGGANESQLFFRIILPMMRSTSLMVFSYLAVCTWVSMSALFTIFAGQPGPYYNLYTIGYYIYDEAQKGQQGFSLACAASCVLMVLLSMLLILRFALYHGKGRRAAS